MDDVPLGVPEKLSPPPAPCSVFPNAGVCMLRADETPAYWMGQGLAMMVRGGEGGRTAPGDRYSIRLHGAGRLLYPDWGTSHSYERYRVVGWKRATPRRNTALIDGKEGWCHRTIYRHAFHPEVKYLSLRGSAYAHDRMERAFMMTKEYLLDVYDLSVHPDTVPEMDFQGVPRGNQYVGWTGASLLGPDGKMPNSHTFDWIVHGLGRQFPRNWELYKPDEELMKESWPNRWLENVQRRDIGEDELIVDCVQTSAGLRPDRQIKGCGPLGRRNAWRQFGDGWWNWRAGVRLRMLGEPGTVVYTAEAPWRPGVVDRDRHPEETLKTVWVRRHGKAALFAALHEAYKDKPVIRDFAYLHRSKPGEVPRVVAAKVVGPAYVDRLYMTLGLPGLKGKGRGGVGSLRKGKEEVRNLTLDWLFKTDPNQIGEKRHWFATEHDRSAWRKVNAGVNWQSFEKGYYGTAWYAKNVAPLELPAGGKVYLLFEGVDEDAWVYVDGQKVCERVAKYPGQVWNKPILVDVTDTFGPGKPHLLAVKVRKMSHQTGIYLPVRLLVGTSKGRVQPGKVPVVTVTSDDDPNEQVAFRGQAYLRASGKRLIARGDIESLCVHAPGVNALVLNGKEAPCRKAGDYVLYGDAKAPAAGKRRAVAAKSPQLKPSSPVEVSFPQVYPNVDAVSGGTLIVRVTNRSANPLSGELEVRAGKKLKVEPATRAFASLKPDCRSEFAFPIAIAGAEAGTIVPVKVLARVKTPSGMVRAHTRRIEVAVGLVFSEIEEKYIIPEYDCTAGMPGKLKPQDAERPYGYSKSYDFSYVQVRAPGYTARVDKPSGTVKYLMDPAGKLRSNQAGHLYSKIRIRKYGGSYHQVSSPRDPTTALLGPSGFAWKDEAEFLGIEPDEKGLPVARFRSADGKSVGEYHFGAQSFTVGPKMSFKGLDIPASCNFIKTADSIGFAPPDELELADNEPVVKRYKENPPLPEPVVGPNLLAGHEMKVEDAEGVKVGAGLGYKGSQGIEVDLAKVKGPFKVDFPVSIKPGRYEFSCRMRHEAVKGVPPHTHSGDRPFAISVLRAGRPGYWSSARNQSGTILRTNPSYRPGGTRGWYVTGWRDNVDIHARVIFQVSLYVGATGKMWYSDFAVRRVE